MAKLTKNLRIVLPILLAGVLLIGCEARQENNAQKNTVSTDKANKVVQNSDPKALAIADSVIEAMGGAQAWEETKVIRWNFFGRRTHTWDKEQGRDRISIPGQNMEITLDLKSKEGTVVKNGEPLTQPDSVQKYLETGYSMWVNDSYWLVMPFKLKDPGVSLGYMGLDTTRVGTPAHKLKLTFGDVGMTPENKYHVYVDTTDHLIKQWAYFSKASDDTARFVLPWKDYNRYGNILLSGNRGSNTLSDIEVLEEWPYKQ
ncbi:hypothetical protein LX73_0427 [Fodinibius salinus]|uniref:Lipoprotein n=2 Tax=Fodinibius salinus TaxID=860790 RepID=A0A5D3YN57_9BACT|nr:hypothetical protein LX73_0427 [Fodinibius salinus]